MGLLDPGADDRSEGRKPRFLQDMLAFLIMGVAGLGALLYVIFFT